MAAYARRYRYAGTHLSIEPPRQIDPDTLGAIVVFAVVLVLAVAFTSLVRSFS